MNRIQVLRPIAILLVAVGAISLATNSTLNLALELNPDYAEAYGNRAFIRNEMKDKQNAISDLQKAAQLFRSRSGFD